MRGGLEDTICAIATPAGEGGIGIVRLSGSQALSIASEFVRLRSGRLLASIATHTLHLADLLLPPSARGAVPSNSGGDPSLMDHLDEALVVYMKAPRSYTGEDVVEIQMHGGGLVLALLCHGCVSAGARLAQPGEFTKRAFLNGRLDLSQAEAVLDTIRAKSSASLAVAQRQLRGDVAREVEAARAALLGLLAHLEAGIDFVEEDISFIEQGELKRTIEKVIALLGKLRATTREGRLLREGARVVILGRPNVGKSSIMNRLLKEERAIVTAIAGTTRDVIEESIDLGGLMVHVVDTAGIRETDDEVEREGVKRSRSAQEEADLQLIVIDGSLPLTADDLALIDRAIGQKHVVAVNKCDLPLHVNPSSLGADVLSVAISAKSGMGIDTLRETIRAQLVGPGGETRDGVVVTNVRHQTALERAEAALQQARASIKEGMAAELVAIDVRSAADALGEITGAITTDEILEQIFSEFCIGK
jgi:tRNA modification GTPase